MPISRRAFSLGLASLPLASLAHAETPVTAEAVLARWYKLVLELVRHSECSAYDCEFVALAVRLDSKLVTMDGKVLKACPKIAVPLLA